MTSISEDATEAELHAFVRASACLYDQPTSAADAAAVEARRAEADRWVAAFQSSPRAWRVCDRVLVQPSLQQHVYFLAAQTLREKVRRDFGELDNAAARAGVRDSLLAHAARLQDVAAVRVQLALAVAGVAVHMAEEWEAPGPLETMVARFGTPALADALLEILSVTPEEVANDRFYCTDRARSCAREQVAAFSPRCVEILMHFMQSTGQNRALQEKVLRCFLSWVSLGSVRDEDLAGRPLFEATFGALAVPELFEVGMRIVAAMLRTTRDVNRFPATVNALIPRVLGLVPALDEIVAAGRAERDADRCRAFADVFAGLGCSYLPLLLNGSPVAMRACEAVLKCSAHPDPSVSGRTFYFWYQLRRHIQAVPDAQAREQKRRVFAEAFSGFARVLVSGMRWARDFDRMERERDTSDEYDDFRQHRHHAGDALVDCCDVLGAEAVLRQICARFTDAWAAYSENRAEWHEIEALLHGVRSIGARVTVLKDRSLISQVLAVLPEFRDHHMPRYSALLVLGRYSVLLNERPELLAPALTYVVQSLADPRSVAAAVQSFRYVCADCARHLVRPPFFDQLIGVLHRFVTALSLEDSCELIEGIAALVSQLTDEQLPGALQQMLLPLAGSLHERLRLPPDRLQAKETRRGVCHDLERIEVVINKVDPTGARPVVAAVLAGLLQQMWDLFGRVLASYKGHDLEMEKLARVWTRAIRKTGTLFEPMLVPLLTELLAAFPAHRHSSFIYVASVLTKVFGHDARFHATLLGVFTTFSEHVLGALESGGADAYVAAPDIVDDYFDLVARFARVCPGLLLAHPLLPRTVACGVAGLGCDHPQASASLMAAFAALFEVGVPVPPGYRPADDHVRVLEQVLAHYGAPLFAGLVAGVAGALSFERTKAVHRVFEAALAFRRRSAASLMSGALAGVSLEPAKPSKDEFLRQWLAAAGPDERKAMVYDLSRAFRRAARH